MKHLKSLFLIGFLFLAGIAIAQKPTLIIPDGITNIQGQAIDKEHKYLYTLSTSKAIMWDIATGRQLYSFKLDGEEVSSIAVSNDGTQIAIAANQKTYCFSTINGKLLFKTHEYYVGVNGGLIFSPDSKTLIVANHGLTILNAVNGNLQYSIEGWASGENYRGLFFLKDETKLVVPDVHYWEVYDMSSRSRIFKFDIGRDYFMAGMPDQEYAITTTHDRYATDQVKVLNLNTGQIVKKFFLKGIDVSDGVVLPSRDSHELILCSSNYLDPKRYLINTENFTVEKTLVKKISDIKSTFFFGKRNLAYCLLYDQLVKFDTQTENVVQTYTGIAAAYTSFTTIDYNESNGILHITPDDHSIKKIDLYKLKTISHTKVNLNLLDAAISSSGDTIAHRDLETHKVTIKNIINGKNIGSMVTLPNPSNGTFSYMRFSRDGKKLYYSFENAQTDRAILSQFDLKTKTFANVLNSRKVDGSLNSDEDRFTGIERARNTVTSFGVWNTTNGTRLFKVPLTDEEFNDVNSISLSKDKNFALTFEKYKINYYSLKTGSLISSSPELHNNYEKFFNFVPNSDLSLIVASVSRGVAGTVGNISIFNRTGDLLHDFHAHDDVIYSILFSPDEKLFYTVSADHTIKVWRTQTGEIIGTLYLFKNTNDFVFIDQDGRFDGSEAGISQLYFLRDRNVLPLDHLFEKFYTPNLYQRLVNGEKLEPIPTDNINPSPKVKISYAQLTRNLNVVDDKIPAYNNTTGLAEITVNATAENDKIDEIRLFHNGKIVNLATRGLFVTDNTTGSDTKKYTINLLPGVNNIRAVALNSQRTESERDEILVNYTIGASPNAPTPSNTKTISIVSPIDKNATLHLIVVGINQYKNPKMSLNYALADATAFKDEAERDAKTMLTNLKTYFVTDDKADKAGILSAFKEVQKNAKPQDVFVFYYAGHGVISEKNKEFYLVPNDVTDLKNVDAALAQNGIPSKVLQQYAIDIAAQKQVFILDACQSAGAFATLMTDDANQQKSLAVVARSTGTHWIAASGSQQFANEFSQLGHGAFTYVLLQGLKGEANSNKMITVNGLKNFLQIGVPALMKKYNGSAQYPASYGFGNDFPVEVVNQE